MVSRCFSMLSIAPFFPPPQLPIFDPQYTHDVESSSRLQAFWLFTIGLHCPPLISMIISSPFTQNSCLQSRVVFPPLDHQSCSAEFPCTIAFLVPLFILPFPLPPQWAPVPQRPLLDERLSWTLYGPFLQIAYLPPFLVCALDRLYVLKFDLLLFRFHLTLPSSIWYFRAFLEILSFNIPLEVRALIRLTLW